MLLAVEPRHRPTSSRSLCGGGRQDRGTRGGPSSPPRTCACVATCGPAGTAFPASGLTGPSEAPVSSSSLEARIRQMPR